jgi:hypothetical protein
MKILSNRVGAIALVIASGFGPLDAAELQPATSSAWEAYVARADQQMRARVASVGPFLWVDGAPGRKQRVQDGAILVAPGMGSSGTETVPGGLIHHWLAAAFIPQANLPCGLGVAHDFAHYKQFYWPAVVDSKPLSGRGEHQDFSMRSLHRVLFITTAMESQFATIDFPMDAKRWYIVADSTRVQEIENYGQPNERLLPPTRSHGFTWRLHTITRYEERDGGVYVEMEAMALSRDIPAAIRWFVAPAIARFSQSEIMTSLRQTREAVIAAVKAEQRVNVAEAAGLAAFAKAQ